MTGVGPTGSGPPEKEPGAWAAEVRISGATVSTLVVLTVWLSGDWLQPWSTLTPSGVG